MMIRSMLVHNNNPENGSLITTVKTKNNHQINLDEPQPQIVLHTARPRTTPLSTRKPQQRSLLNSTLRHSHLVNWRSVEAAEQELSTRFKSDMNSYLLKKFRTIVSKREQDMISDRSLNRTIDMADLQNTSKLSVSGTVDNFMSLVSHEHPKMRFEKVVDESYLLTAKERIARLIDMKKEADDKYTTIHSTITARRDHRAHIQKKNNMRMPKKEPVEEQKWDKEWREDRNLETRRYRSRLFQKHIKNNSPLFGLAH